MIMNALGISDALILTIFRESIAEILGLKRRVMGGRMTKADADLISTCSEVSPYM